VIEKRTTSVLDQGSAVKIIPASSGHPKNNSPTPEIPKEYWYIFDQMANNQQ